MHRQELLRLLTNYHTRFMEEAGYVQRAHNFVVNYPDCFNRELLHAHVTGSAWVVNPDMTKILMLHHRKLDQWFQPGGHADGDADILRVALRETAEESGLNAEQIQLLGNDIFDVDIHTIQASEYAPRHEHIDIRFLVEVDDRLPIPGNDESHDVIWVPLESVTRFNNNRSTFRMLNKTRYMKNNTLFDLV